MAENTRWDTGPSEERSELDKLRDDIEIRELESRIKVRVANQMRKNSEEFLSGILTSTLKMLELVCAERYEGLTLPQADGERLKKWYEGQKKEKPDV